jgi:uncharacterized protein (TIGR01777 family)
MFYHFNTFKINMTILIAGGSGLIGTRLTNILVAKGYTVAHLTRKTSPNAICQQYIWDVENGTIDDQAILEADYIINLAGAGIADARWTIARKALIISSRAQSAALIRSSILRLKKQPKAYISAAAIGFYGDSGSKMVDESSVSGEGFLAESCVAWEAATQSLQDAAPRVVTLRIGIVLSTLGGALQKTIAPLRLGVASYFGNGAQYYSWIHIDDVCHAFIKAVEDVNVNGIYNAVSPNPISNKNFTKVLQKCFGGFSLLLPAPNFVLRILLGEMADVVITGTNTSATKLLKTDFQFQFSDLSDALYDLLKRKI